MILRDKIKKMNRKDKREMDKEKRMGNKIANRRM
jgi:hypothetical protein